MKNIASASLYRKDGYRTIVSLQSGPVEITDAEIVLNSMTVDSAMIEGESFEIGTAISDQVVLTLDNSNGTYSAAFVGVEFDLYIAPFPVDGSVAREDADWSLLGTYVVTQADTTYNDRITLTLNDRFVLMDQKIPSGTFATSKTLYQHLSAFCTTLGIGLSLTATEQTFLSNITVVAPSSNAAWFADMTYRDFVRGIAGIMWENAKMTPDGSLAFRQTGTGDLVGTEGGDIIFSDRLSQYIQELTTGDLTILDGIPVSITEPTPGDLVISQGDQAYHETTPSNRYSSYVQEMVSVGSIEVVGMNGAVYYSTGDTSEGQRVTIDEGTNYIVQMIGPTLLAGYYGALTVLGAATVGMTYRPMQITCLPFWEAEPGDGVLYFDKEGNVSLGLITSMAGVINGAMSITSAGASAQQQFQYIGKLTNSDLSTLHAVQSNQNQITDMLPVVQGFSTSLQQTEQNIMANVSSAYLSRNEFGTYQQDQSASMNIMSGNIDFLLENNVTQTDVDGKVSELSTSISKLIRLSADQAIEIGLLNDTGSSLSLKLDNDEIGFYKDGTRIAYWDGNMLFTGDAYIGLNNMFRIGGFAAVPRSSGNVSWLKVGE